MGERRAATAGVPGRPGHRRWRGLAGPGLPGRRPPLHAHWTGARRGRPVCGGQGASRLAVALWSGPTVGEQWGQLGLTPTAITLAVARRAAWTACRRPGPGARRRIEAAVAWRRARELGRLRRASAAAGDAGQMPSLPGPGVALVRRWRAHRVPADARGPGPGGMRSRARHLTIARCRPRWRPGRRRAEGRDPGRPAPRARATRTWAWYGWPSPALSPPGQVGLSPRHRRAAQDRPRDRPRSCGDGPSGLGPVRHRLMSGCAVTGAGLSGARFPWLPGARDLTGWPRAAGMARPSGSLGGQCGPCGQPLVPTGHRSPCPDFFEFYRSSWSPVTESNRRSSPYHACRFRLMASYWVGLPQVRGISASGYVALCPPVPGVVVT